MLRPALVLLAFFSLLTGVAYPLAVTGLANTFFPRQAQGSLLRRDGVVIGSELIGQSFEGPGFFHGRPSATGAVPYDASGSSGSNLGPSNPAFLRALNERVAALRAQGGAPQELPVDLVTASGSGLDPHVSPAAARLQVARVAQARGLPVSQVQALVDQNLEPALLGFWGEPRVNVLKLNAQLP